jgi:hypothetical protein
MYDVFYKVNPHLSYEHFYLRNYGYDGVHCIYSDYTHKVS